jgi:hypothetical protein
MQICKSFTCEDWQRLRKRIDAKEEHAWTEAVDAFERRMNERYFRCIDALLAIDGTGQSKAVVPGFSIMGLCCLVAETLHSFYTGGPQPRALNEGETCTFPKSGCLKEPSTARAFKDFLRKSPHFSKDFKNSEIAGDFSQSVRNALLHEAETRSGWIIRKTDPKDHILRKIKDGYVLNRTKFHQALFAEFTDYLARLREHSRKDNTRDNFLKKMDSICGIEPDVE